MVGHRLYTRSRPMDFGPSNATMLATISSRRYLFLSFPEDLIRVLILIIFLGIIATTVDHFSALAFCRNYTSYKSGFNTAADVIYRRSV